MLPFVFNLLVVIITHRNPVRSVSHMLFMKTSQLHHAGPLPTACSMTHWSCFTTTPTAQRYRFLWTLQVLPGGPTSMWSSGTLEAATQTSQPFFKEQRSRWTGAGPSTNWTQIQIITASSMRTLSCGWEPPPCQPSVNSTASSTRKTTWFQLCPEETTLWRSSTIIPCTALRVGSGWSWAPSPGWGARTHS